MSRRSLREHRTAARAWDAARAAATSTRRAGDSSWQEWAKHEAKKARGRLKGQAAGKGKQSKARSRKLASAKVARTSSGSSKTSTWHRVRRGETLSGIAADYGVSVRELKSWNALGSSGRIRAGQRLRIAAPLSRATNTKSRP